MASRRSSALVLLLGCTALGADLQRFESAEPHMGTIFKITLYASNADQASSSFSAAFRRIRELDRTLTDYDESSELMRVSREAAGRPVKVSDDLFRVLETAQALARDTQGAFDITVGPLTHLWRKGVPSQGQVEEALARCGYRKLVLDGKNRTVTLASTGMILDAGGIAKGYAAEAALLLLKSQGIPRALVAASGDLAIGDPPPGSSGWRVGIDHGKEAFAVVLRLRNTRVSTSGDLEQFREQGGKRYSHIIDPRTGQALTDSVTTTAVGADGAFTDALATALNVLGPREALPFVESKTKSAALIGTSGSARWKGLPVVAH